MEWSQREKTAYRPADIPLGEHFAVVEFTSVTIPGDERSRTHPGHGYPEHTDTYCYYHIFPSKVELANWILKHADTKYVVLLAHTMQVDKTVTIDIKPTT